MWCFAVMPDKFVYDLSIGNCTAHFMPLPLPLPLVPRVPRMPSLVIGVDEIIRFAAVSRVVIDSH